MKFPDLDFPKMNTQFEYDRKWKPSLFNIMLSAGTRNLIYNSKSSQSLELQPQQLEIIKKYLGDIERTGECPNLPMLECLISFGFVVSSVESEHEDEREKYLAEKRGKKKLYVTIAPTMACNHRCSYCFQQNLPRKGGMRSDVKEGVIEFIRHKVRGCKGLAVQWFGGEPLLGYRMIVDLSSVFRSICDENEVQYHAEMLTNGVLLTEEVIASFRKMSIRAITIPLDGKPETYASRRGIALNKARKFYEFLIDIMHSITEATGSVCIRINVDKDNAGEAKDVVLMFKDRGVMDPRIDFRLGFLNTSRGIVECIPHNCFSNLEFAGEEKEFRAFLKEQGYSVFGKPEPLDYTCTAILDNAFTIDPEGRIGKCIPSIGTQETVVGRIYPNDIQRTLREIADTKAPFTEFDPFLDCSCKECKLLPVCLGSCPKMHGPRDSFDCMMKKRLDEKIFFYHDYHAAVKTKALFALAEDD